MTATLNREEALIDQAISHLQETVRADIAAFAQTSPSDESGRKLQSQIQRNTTLLRARLRELELLAEEQETIEEGDAVVAVVTKHKRSYEELQRALRNAHLEVQRKAANAAQEQRKALMGAGDYMQRAQQLKTQQDLTNSAADTTVSLQRTRQLMAEELQHTSATLAAMETSDTILKKANKEYKDQRGTIKQSHGLLRTMRKNSIRDSLKLYAALALFAFVIAYVGFRRARYFVPEVVINSLPTLKTFGIGQHKVNSSADLPYLDQRGYYIPDIDPTDTGIESQGRERYNSTADVSPFKSRLANFQTQAGIALRQAAHHSRRLAIWLYQQSRVIIAGIKQRIEERQGKKLEEDSLSGGYGEQGGSEKWPDPSDPAYQVPAAVYEEPAQPRQQDEQASQAQREARPTGAHPGYAGGLEAMYGGSGMRAIVESSGVNATAPGREEDSTPGFNQTTGLEAAYNAQLHQPYQDTPAANATLQATDDPETLESSASSKQTDINVVADAGNNSKSEAALTAELQDPEEIDSALSDYTDIDGTGDTLPAAGGESARDSDTVSAPDETPALEDILEGADKPESDPTDVSSDAAMEDALAEATKPAGLDQEEETQQQDDADYAESNVSDTLEEETSLLPRQGTMADPTLEAEELTSSPAANIPIQEDEEGQAEEGLEGIMQQQDKLDNEDGSDDDKEPAPIVGTDEVPLVGRSAEWPEEGPSKPRAGKDEVQRTGAVGMAGGGAAGIRKGTDLTAPATAGDDSAAIPDEHLEAELPSSKVAEEEGDGKGTASGKGAHLTEEVEGAEPGEESLGHTQAGDLASQAHLKDEL